MSVLITGGNGQLGSDMKRVFEAEGISAFNVDLPELDITDKGSIYKAVALRKPEYLINCAAFTDVDRCESHQDAAFEVNGKGPGYLAEVCSENSIPFVHISTDYVFDGSAGRAYTEADTPNPVSVYGRSKLEGEERVKGAAGKWFVFRVAWLYGVYGNNFVRTIYNAGLKKVQEGGELRVVDDQYGTPTHALNVAQQILRVIKKGEYGLYHCTNEGATTWYGFTKKIMDHLSIPVDVKPCSTEEFPRPAPRPFYSVLENSVLKQNSLSIMKDWEDAFEDFTADPECFCSNV